MNSHLSDAAVLARLGLAIVRDVHGVGQPVPAKRPYFLRDDGSFGLCAWCQKELGLTPKAGESHGICPAHAEAELSKLRRAA